MKVKIFLVLLSFSLYLVDARGVDHSDDENPSDGSDNDAAFSDDDASGSDFSNAFSEESSDEGHLRDGGQEGKQSWIIKEQRKMRQKQAGNNSGADDDLTQGQQDVLRKMIQAQSNQNENDLQSKQASDRLMKEMRLCYRSEMYMKNEYSIELVDDNMYNWNVLVRAIDPDSRLYKDIQKLKQDEGIDGILFNIRFGENYPYEPPFVRVAYPVVSSTYDGGAMCMELLHPKGWSPVYTVEAIITQLTAFLVQCGAGVKFGAKDQGYEAAKKNFDFVLMAHANGFGNYVPPS